MTLLVHIVLLGWIPAVLLLFALLPPRRAVIAAFLGGWLFLPHAGYVIQGLPEYTKMSACCIAPMLGAALFDFRRITSFRPRWLDVPILLWCICPLFSSLSNQLGVYNGLSGVLRRLIAWGVPYFLGRVYVQDLCGLRDLAIAIFVAGLIYVPLCLYESRMSPQLHRIFYGFHPLLKFAGHRLGGWRPVVFLESGLALGLWMTACSLTGVWLWARGALGRLWGLSAGWLVGLLLFATVLCRSTGALAWLGLGLAGLFAMKWTRSRAPIFILLALAPAFAATRATGIWGGREIVEAAEIAVGKTQAGSLEFRLRHDDPLAEKALRRPFFGWGGWGRMRIYDEAGRDISITDGLWIQSLGKNGLVGLASLTATLLLPALVLVVRYPPRQCLSASLAPAIALAIVAVLFMLDCLLNAKENPILALVVGGVSGFCAMSWRPGAERGAAPATATSRDQHSLHG